MDAKLWDRCVNEWTSLRDQIKGGKCKPPISAIIVNGKNVAVTILDIIVSKEIIEIFCKEGKEVVNKNNIFLFKYGKDKKGEMVFHNLNFAVGQ